VGGVLYWIYAELGNAGVVSAVGGLVMVGYLLLAAVLATLGFLIPYFIYVCARELKAIRDLMEQRERREIKKPLD